MIRDIRCGPYTLHLGEKTLIMGILNVTEDSFSDGGHYNSMDKAVAHAVQMVKDGADIIDVGGEGSSLKARKLAVADELKRVIPVVERIRAEVDIPISVDTYKSEVARAGLEAGANLINDISGFQYDPSIAAVAAESQAPSILMHIQGTPRDTVRYPHYQDVVREIIQYLNHSIKIATAAGLAKEKIIIDPGVGFGKDLDHNLAILQRLYEFQAMGYPILLGTSRKSVIGNILKLPVSDRVEGTGATVALGIAFGADIMRVHDVLEMARVAKMADAIVRIPDQPLRVQRAGKTDQ